MVSRLTELSLDCADPERLARFWCAVLGWQVVATGRDLVEISPGPLDDAARLAAVRAGAVVPTLVLARTPEPKSVKNRVHLDVSPVDRTHEQEVARLLELGAAHADVGQSGQESWTVLADPEGNEFCVLRSLAEGSFAL